MNIPLDKVSKEAIDDLRTSGNSPLFLICQSGTRSKTACQKLADLGNIATVEGGTQAWIDNGLPVVEGEPVMSLERQVRIAAGSLVVLGTILGVTISPWFLGLSGFVGAGLVFAGVTDTCGMAILLSKCPWNQNVACLARKEARS